MFQIDDNFGITGGEATICDSTGKLILFSHGFLVYDSNKVCINDSLLKSDSIYLRTFHKSTSAFVSVSKDTYVLLTSIWEGDESYLGLYSQVFKLEGSKILTKVPLKLLYKGRNSPFGIHRNIDSTHTLVTFSPRSVRSQTVTFRHYDLDSSGATLIDSVSYNLNFLLVAFEQRNFAVSPRSDYGIYAATGSTTADNLYRYGYDKQRKRVVSFDVYTDAIRAAKGLNGFQSSLGVGAIGGTGSFLYLYGAFRIRGNRFVIPRISMSDFSLDSVAVNFRVNTQGYIHYKDCKLGIDNKIYYSPTIFDSDSLVLVIDNPDEINSKRVRVKLLPSFLKSETLPTHNTTLLVNAFKFQATADRRRICEGDSTNLSAYGAGVDTVLWSGPNTRFLSDIRSGNPVFRAGAPGRYTFNVRGSNPDTVINNSVWVDVLPRPQPILIRRAGFCVNSTVTLNALQRISAGFTYRWSNGATTPQILVSNAGNYWVETSNGTCSRFDTVAVVAFSLSAKPVINLASSPRFCPGDSVVLSAPNSPAYRWSNGAATRTISIQSEGKFSVEVLDTNGCFSAPSDTVQTFVKPVPAAPLPVLLRPAIFCTGDSAIIQAPLALGYRWNNGASTRQITVKNTASLTLQVLDTSGCWSAPASIELRRLPIPQGRITGQLSICPGQRNVIYKYVGDSTSIGSLNWAIVGGSITSQAGDSVVLNWQGTRGTGQIKVVARSRFGCTSDTIRLNIRINPRLQPEPVKGDTLLCADNRVGNYVAPFVPTAAYTWVVNGGQIISSRLNIATVRWDSTFGVKTIRYVQDIITTDTICQGISGLLNVRISPTPLKPILEVNNASLCEDDTLVFRPLNAPINTQYRWSSGETTSIIKRNLVGNFAFTLRYQDDLGCISPPSDTIRGSILALPPRPQIEVFPDSSICADMTFELRSVNPAPAFRWSNGDTARLIITRSTAQLSLQVLGTNGCWSRPQQAPQLRFKNCEDSVGINYNNIISLNSDTKNDVLKFVGTELESGSINIFNRWGRLVFTADPYRNTWPEGEVPVGTYYFLYQGSRTQLKGWVEVVR